MFSKKYVPGMEEDAPTPDESWWASVLADEEDPSATPRDTGTRSGGQAQQMLVDWEHVKELYDKDEIVTLSVHGYNRGGLLVEGDGLQGFVPVSHLVDMPNAVSEEERRAILSEYVDRELNLKVIECEPDQERVVFSERAALAGEGRRKMLFQSLKPGECVKGVVTNVTDFGAFVDLGGLEGLIHVSELSWGRVQHPSEVLSVGREVQALVLQISEENSRIALSLKRLEENPWETIVERYKTGDTVKAVVTGITRFGAFARLEEGIEGLIHVSSMNLSHGHTDINKFLSKGQEVTVRILHIEAEKRRLGLSLVSGDE